MAGRKKNALSPTQIKITALFILTMSRLHVCDVLCFTINTLKKHESRMYGFSGHYNRADHTIWALNNGFTKDGCYLGCDPLEEYRLNHKAAQVFSYYDYLNAIPPSPENT